MLRKVLCVDTDETLHTYYKYVLNKVNFAIDTSTYINIQEATSYLKRCFNPAAENDGNMFPGLIFLDINMPFMEEWVFLDWYTQEYANKLPDTKIVIITNSFDPEDYLRSNDYEVVISFINKPISKAILENLKHHSVLKHNFFQ
jgi:CheY-like chemotaxis protein